jgi:ElaB/YqjD/DUF883 family membrane-anchored ribosome-binding protein
MNDMSEKTSGFVRDLGQAARQNPLSAALIGMGVLWLFTGARTAERAGEMVGRIGLDRVPDVASDAMDSARSTLRSGSDAIGDRLASAKDALQDGSARVSRKRQDYADTASEYVSSIPEAGMDMFDTVRSNLSEVFRAQPLALGAIGLAIGAGIAAALPPSDVEAEYIGETSDALKQKASEFATEQTTRATAVAESVLAAVADEASKQGLTLENAKSAAGEISAKVGRVVDAATKG